MLQLLVLRFRTASLALFTICCLCCLSFSTACLCQKYEYCCENNRCVDLRIYPVCEGISPCHSGLDCSDSSTPKPNTNKSIAIGCGIAAAVLFMVGVAVTVVLLATRHNRNRPTLSLYERAQIRRMALGLPRDDEWQDEIDGSSTITGDIENTDVQGLESSSFSPPDYAQCAPVHGMAYWSRPSSGSGIRSGGLTQLSVVLPPLLLPSEEDGDVRDFRSIPNTNRRPSRQDDQMLPSYRDAMDCSEKYNVGATFV